MQCHVSGDNQSLSKDGQSHSACKGLCKVLDEQTSVFLPPSLYQHWIGYQRSKVHSMSWAWLNILLFFFKCSCFETTPHPSFKHWQTASVYKATIHPESYESRDVSIVWHQYVRLLNVWVFGYSLLNVGMRMTQSWCVMRFLLGCKDVTVYTFGAKISRFCWITIYDDYSMHCLECF